MKTTVAEIVELIDKIENTRQDLLKMDDNTADVAADLLWEYLNIIRSTKVEI